MKSDIIKILSDWNPWWEHGKVPENLCGVKREKSEEFIRLESMKEIKIITGVRRSGKSTLLYQVIDSLLKKGIAPKDILLINFEDAGIAHYALDEIHESYLSELNPTYSLHIFIDEVQKKEGWERWIRKKYDLRQAAGFFVSGSSSALLKKEYSTLLTGRNLSLEVFPLDFNEYLQFSGMKIENLKTITLETQSKISFNLKKYIEFGGFPEVFFKDESNKRLLLNQYFEDIIYKDVVDRYKTDPGKTKETGIYLLTNICNPLSIRSLRNISGLGTQTISEYISHMAEAYLIYQVSIYSPSLKVQSANPKKIYSIDTGLRNAVSFKFSEDVGRLAENTVFIELKRRGKEVFYWKDEINGEVDFIIKEGLKPSEAIQVCWNLENEGTKNREIKPLCNALNEFKLDSGLIITDNLEKEEIIGGKKIIFTPLWKWLLSK